MQDERPSLIQDERDAAAAAARTAARCRDIDDWEEYNPAESFWLHAAAGSLA